MLSLNAPIDASSAHPRAEDLSFFAAALGAAPRAEDSSFFAAMRAGAGLALNAQIKARDASIQAEDSRFTAMMLALSAPIDASSAYVNGSYEAISHFLQLVADGQQDEAEAMLIKYPGLGLHSGYVKDHAGRLFTNITGFQYAVWALDWQMWTMIRKYLTKDELKEQAQGFVTGSWVAEHGEHAGRTIQDVIDRLKYYSDTLNSLGSVSEFNRSNNLQPTWQHVGEVQRKLPMHVLQEYFCPGIKTTKHPLPLIIGGEFLGLPILEWIIKNYDIPAFTLDLTRTNLRESFCKSNYLHGILRGQNNSTKVYKTYPSSTTSVLCDKFFCIKLLEVRSEQRNDLIAELGPKPLSVRINMQGFN